MRHIWLLALSALVAPTGCDPDDPCDPGQVYERGTCHEAATDAGPATDAGYPGFGDPCTDPKATDECTVGDATQCIPIPGMDPFCSALGCLDDPTLCPPDWSCVDVSAVDPRAVGGVCLPP